MYFYDLTVKDRQNNDIPLSLYKGKVLLIVNTATACGFTPQYKDLQDLYLKYKDRGFEVLDFPCNQFGGQAPGTNEEIANFCELKYHTTFTTFAKIDVNGKEAAPLYKCLKEKSNGILGEAIKWNFTKFLVDKKGNVVHRYAPTTNPSKIADSIEKILTEQSMRLWSLHPRYLDSAGMNACWREGLLARNVLLGNTKGYTHHPQLIRFQESSDPLLYIDAFLTQIYIEALKRHFSYTKSKIRIVENIHKIPVTQGQLEYEFEHLKNKLKKRSPELLLQMPTLTQLESHPLFKIIKGDIEKWEIVI